MPFAQGLSLNEQESLIPPLSVPLMIVSLTKTGHPDKDTQPTLTRSVFLRM